MDSPTILTRAPGDDLSAAALTFLERSAIDTAAATDQHKAYCRRLSEAGGEVATLPALEEHPDACFVEDVLIALPEMFILCRPGIAMRRKERRTVKKWLPKDRPIAKIKKPATLEGGDVLKIGRTLFVGRSTRTNEAGIEALAALVEPLGYEVTRVPVMGALHLKTAATAPTDDLVLMNPAWIDPAPFADFQKIYAPAAEPFAGNCLRLGDRVFVPAAHEETMEILGDAGLFVEPINISEFAKAEAGLTCLSVVID